MLFIVLIETINSGFVRKDVIIFNLEFRFSYQEYQAIKISKSIITFPINVSSADIIYL